MRLILYTTAFVSNAAILVFEIAGARFLAPYLGTSTEVWAGMIAVILGGMSLGYWLGGIFADKYPSQKVLGGIILLSGVSALIAWGLRDIIPTLFASHHVLPLTFTTIIVALFIFAPTAAFLGAVSPFVARCLLVDMDSSARVIGRVSAIGTAGSIIGTIVTGAFLIPTFGVSAILLGTAIVLIMLAALVSLPTLIKKPFLLIGAAVVAFTLGTAPVYGKNLIADVSTPYNRIWIFEGVHDGLLTRYLQTDPFAVQCAMRVNSDGTVDEHALAFGYFESFEIAAKELLAQKPDAQALFLGGCNHSYPRAFLLRHPDASAHVVEIDPGMTEAAEEYFGFSAERFPHLSITHADARTFIEKDVRAYDLIFLDAFGSAANIPFHLTTKEMFTKTAEHVAPGGLFMMNVIAAREGPSSLLAASLARTAGEAFPHVSLYEDGQNEDPLHPVNILIVGSREPLPDTFAAPLVASKILTRINLDGAVPGLLLTDEYAPTEVLARPIQEALF